MHAAGGGVVGFALSVTTLALLAALEEMKENGDFAYVESVRAILRPREVGTFLELFGSLTVGIISGLFVAAVVAVRHGDTAGGMGADEIEGPER